MNSRLKILFGSKLFLSFLWFIVFIYWCGVGRYKWFLFQLVKLAQDFPVNCEEYPYSKSCVKVTENKKRLSPSTDIKLKWSFILTKNC